MNWREATLACVDVETNGLEDDSKIVELGMFRCEASDLDGGTRFGTLVNPGVTIPDEAIAVHGITDKMVADAPKIEDVADAFLARVRSADVLCGYNIWDFDDGVLRREIGEAWTEAIEGKPMLDALALVRMDGVGRWWKGKGRHRLENVVRRCELTTPRKGNAHRASWDAEMSTRILFHFGSHIPNDAVAAEAWMREAHEEDRARFKVWKDAQPKEAS